MYVPKPIVYWAGTLNGRFTYKGKITPSIHAVIATPIYIALDHTSTSLAGLVLSVSPIGKLELCNFVMYREL